MELSVGVLKKILEELDDDVILATLEIGNDRFQPFHYVKRLMLLKETQNDQEYLTINTMGSHFTQTGEQKNLVYMSRYWDEDNL